ncbi:MAG: hypothetical protein ACE5D4_02610 [Thermodesulfobacteriota bacterium]
MDEGAVRRVVARRGITGAHGAHNHREIRPIAPDKIGDGAMRGLSLSYDRKLLERSEGLRRTIEGIQRRMNSYNRPVSMDNCFYHFQDG